MSDAQRSYYTTPIYYASGEPHIGHAYTTILTDVLARFDRQEGREVLFRVDRIRGHEEPLPRANDILIPPHGYQVLQGAHVTDRDGGVCRAGSRTPRGSRNAR